MLLIAGCHGKESPPQGQDTPQALARKMQKALVANDKARFDECFTGPRGYREIVDAVIEFSQTACQFYDAITRAYGPSAVAQYHQTKVLPSFDLLVPYKDTDWAEEEITMKGDKAVCVSPNSPDPTILIRRNNIWRVDLTDYCATGQTLISFFKKATKAAKKTTAQVGKPGVTIEDLKRQMGDIFFREP